jgi:hypothetical protein
MFLLVLCIIHQLLRGFSGMAPGVLMVGMLFGLLFRPSFAPMVPG